jgi:hypothetical protein
MFSDDVHCFYKLDISITWILSSDHIALFLPAGDTMKRLVDAQNLVPLIGLDFCCSAERMVGLCNVDGV